MKDDPSRLANFGGSSSFGEKVHVGRANIGDHDQLIVDNCRLTNNGPYVQTFECRGRGLVEALHRYVFMCSATMVLESVIRALSLEGEVTVPSFTSIATTRALRWQEVTRSSRQNDTEDKAR